MKANFLSRGLFSQRDSTEEHWERYWQNPTSQERCRTFNPVLVKTLESALNGLVGKRILEAGCGLAVDTIELARRGAEAVAFDYTISALHQARLGADRETVEVSVGLGDVLRMPFMSNSLDAIFHAGLLEHFRNPIDVLVEQRRVLKPGGILLVDVPQTYNLYTVCKAIQVRLGTWFAGWETQFAVRELEEMLESLGFEVVDAYGYGYFPPILRKVRWMSSIGLGWMGRPLMPSWLASKHDSFWIKVEESRAFLYISQSIGVVGRLRRS